MKDFEKLDVLAIDFSKSLAKISMDSAGMRKIATATNATALAFEKANVSAAAYETRLAAIHRLGAAPAMGRGRLPPAGGGFGGGHGGGGGFHGGNIHMGGEGVRLGTVGMAAGDWFWPIAATGAMAYGGKALYESAKDLNTEQNRFRLFGMTEAQNQEAFGYAKNMSVFGTTQLERLTAMRESQGVFRESGLSGSAALAGAKLAAPVLAKLDFLAASLDDESRAKMHTANLAMLRYVESSGGLKSASEFNRIADFGYKLNVSSGGTVNWPQLLQFKQRAKVAGFSLTNDAMARLEPTIAEAKGGAAGYGLSTAFNRLNGINRMLPISAIRDYLEMGLWDRSKVVLTKNGGVKQFLGNPLSKDKSEMFATNPELFYETFVRPYYEKHHFSFTDRARENTMLFGGTGGYNATLWEKQNAIIQSSVLALTKTRGIDAAGKIAQDTLTGNEKEFVAAWTDFKTSFGTSILPLFTGLLKGGSSILRQLPDTHSPLAYTTGWAFIHDAFSMLKDDLSSSTSHDSRFVGGRYGGRDVHVTVSADARKLGLQVTQQQAKHFSMPQTGTGYFDSLQAPMPAGGLP